MPLRNRDVEPFLDPLDIAPVKLRLEDAGVLDAHPAALMAFGDVALAPAVAVGVDGQAKGVITLVDGAAHMVVNPMGVAAHIELEDLEAVARGLGSLVEPRLDPGTQPPGARRDRLPPAGIARCLEH